MSLDKTDGLCDQVSCGPALCFLGFSSNEILNTVAKVLE